MFEYWLNSDLKKPLKIERIDGALFSHDNNGNKIGVKVYSDGQPVTLSGTVSGNFILPSGATVAATSKGKSGNTAYVLIPQAALLEVGQITVVIKLVEDYTITTLGCCVITVVESITGEVIDPGTLIDDIDTLIARIDSAVDSIPADYTELLETLAPDFDENEPYQSGRMVWHDGVLYRFTADHEEGSWDSTEVEAVIVGDEISYAEAAGNSRDGSDVLRAVYHGKYIVTSGDTADITDLRTAAEYDCWIYPCAENDAFTVCGSSGSNPRLWAFVAANGNVLDKSISSAIGEYVITAPANTAYLVVNCLNTAENNVYRGRILRSYVRENTESVRTVENGFLNVIEPGAMSESYKSISANVGTRVIGGREKPGRYGVKYSLQTVVDASAEYSFDVNIRSLSGLSTDEITSEPYGTHMPYTPSGEDVYTVFRWQRHVDYGEQDAIIYYRSADGETLHSLTVPICKAGDGLQGVTIINLTKLMMADSVSVPAYYDGCVTWTATAAASTATKTGYTAQDQLYLEIEWYGLYTQGMIERGFDIYEKASRIMDDESKAGIAARGLVPDYWMNLPANPTSFSADGYLDSCGKKIPTEGFKCIFVTDTHWSPRNAQHSPEIAGYIAAKYGIDYCLFGGDVIDLDHTSEEVPASLAKYRGLRTMRDCFSKFRSVFGSRFFPTVGNHDQNVVPAIITGATDDEIREYSVPYSQIMPESIGQARDIHCFYPAQKVAAYELTAAKANEVLAMCAMNYYADDVKSRTRIICLNTGTPACAGNPIYEAFNDTVSPLRLIIDWLYNALMTVREGWDVIMFAHAVLGQNDPTAQDSYMMTQVLSFVSSYLRHGKHKIYGGSLNAWLRKWLYGDPESSATFVEYRFESAPAPNKLVFLTGDGHFDAVRKITGNTDNNDWGTSSVANAAYGGEYIDESTGAFPVIETTCDGYLAQKQTVPSGAVVPTMTEGTVTEQAMDAVTLTGWGVKLVRIGAGSDRNVYIL